jgi:carboxypeptidase PM20D1
LYPLSHNALSIELVLDHSLVYHWAGTSSAQPLVLMAHQDVVDVSPDQWDHPPFSGDIVDGVVWGRGAIDDKGALVSIFEAVESLLEAGFIPGRDVYLVLGHNEEIAGNAVPTIVDLFRSRSIEPALVIDEGGAVVRDAFPGVSQPLAVIGIAEKGLANVELTAHDPGGHAATPSRRNATARLALAVVNINAKPFPTSLSDPVRQMLTTIAPHAPAALRLPLSRLRVLTPVLRRVLPRLSPELNAMCRTTAVTTMLHGSPGANVLAETATAVVNVRIAPGDSTASVLAHLRHAIKDDQIDLRVLTSSEPSPISRTDDDMFRLLSHAVSQVHPDAIVTPYLMMAASDSRHFSAISEHVYRFTPFPLSQAERATLHAANERLPVESLRQGIKFYRALLQAV